LKEISDLRSLIPQNSGSPSWLRFLDDDQLAEIKKRLESGRSHSEIIKLVQNEFRLATNNDPKKMIPDLVKFKAKILVGNKKEAQELDPATKLKLVDLSSKVDGLGRMGWLIDIQTERILNILNKEKMGLPLSIAHTNIKTLGSLLDKYVRTQVDLGLLNKDQEEQLVGVEGQFQGIMDMLGEGKDRVTDATRKLLLAVDQRANRYRVNEDGTIEKAPDVEVEESNVHRTKVGND